jgi:GIY-YIG catalytic domain
MKTKISTENRSGVVYKIGCSDCDQFYIGETSKKLYTRVGQHQSDYKRRNTPGPKTALTNHTIDHNHRFDFENASILDRENNVQKRRLFEAGHIIIHGKDAVNIKSDSQLISKQYYIAIKKYKMNISPKRPRQQPSRPPYLNQTNNSLSLNTDSN